MTTTLLRPRRLCMTLAGFVIALNSMACQRDQTAKPELEDKSAAPLTVPSASATPTASTPSTAEHALLAGNATRGKGLIETFECNRCHEVEGHAAAVQAKHCIQCHDDIVQGRFRAPASALARWQKTVDPYTVAPSLRNVGQRFDKNWLYSFLRNPVDLRPHLTQSMPRLELTDTEAADLAAYLSANAEAKERPLPNGDAQRGRKVMDDKSCASCHVFSGVPAFRVSPDIQSTEQQKRAARLAPDLRFTRDRFRQSAIVEWLRNPQSMKPDTLMPSHSLDAREALDIAAYLYNAELAPLPPRTIPERLPVLDRRVAFDEVMTKVFGVTCRHCHSDPDAALGDGGPGNSGGFGFKPKGLDLATYRGVAAGYLDAQGQRQSVFAPLADSDTPRLLAVLLARQSEEAGQAPGSVRGMPLGLPALTPEQIQLVESWIAQGRPR